MILFYRILNNFFLQTQYMLLFTAKQDQATQFLGLCTIITKLYQYKGTWSILTQNYIHQSSAYHPVKTYTCFHTTYNFYSFIPKKERMKDQESNIKQLWPFLVNVNHNFYEISGWSLIRSPKPGALPGKLSSTMEDEKVPSIVPLEANSTKFEKPTKLTFSLKLIKDYFK